MAEVRYMIDFPNGDEPGQFIEQGTFTEAEAIEYLSQWFGTPLDLGILQFFCTEVSTENDEGNEEDV